MRRTLIVASLALAVSFFTRVMGQSELKRYELSALFTSITKPDNFGNRTEAGFGGRFTFNFNDNVAVEGEGQFFPGNCFSCRFDNVGKLTQGFAGIKAGKRFKRFGVFAKARPGVASFSRGEFDLIIQTGPPFIFPPFALQRARQTHLAFDVGGVVEIYHSKRIFTRFDAGDTMIHYGSRVVTLFQIDSTGGVTTVPIPFRAETRHNFQFSAGVGFRF